MKKGALLLAVVTLFLSGICFFSGCKNDEKETTRYEMKSSLPIEDRV